MQIASRRRGEARNNSRCGHRTGRLSGGWRGWQVLSRASPMPTGLVDGALNWGIARRSAGDSRQFQNTRDEFAKIPKIKIALRRSCRYCPIGDSPSLGVGGAFRSALEVKNGTGRQENGVTGSVRTRQQADPCRRLACLHDRVRCPGWFDRDRHSTRRCHCVAGDGHPPGSYANLAPTPASV